MLIFCAFALMFCLLAVPAYWHLLNHDIAWMLCAADKVLDGQQLYVEVYEVNPPLIIWLKIPVVMLSHAWGISEIQLYRTMVLIVTALSLIMSSLLLRRLYPDSQGIRFGWIFLMMLLLLPGAGYMVGQREHLLLICVQPYILSTIIRAQGMELSRKWAIVIGLFAGVGIALKPYFVPFWILMELYLWRATSKRAMLFRSESISIGFVLFLYGLVVLIFVPQYLAQIRLFQEAYSNFAQKPWIELFQDYAVYLTAISFLLTMLIRPRSNGKAGCEVYAVATVGLLIAMVLQKKGFDYHYFPVFVLGVSLLFFLSWEGTSQQQTLSKVIGVVCALLMIGSALSTTIYRYNRGRYWQGTLTRTDSVRGQLIKLGQQQKVQGKYVYFLSAHLPPAFPVVNYWHAKWPVRFPSLWVLSGLYRNAKAKDGSIVFASPEAMGKLEAHLFDSIITDLQRHPPTLLCVDPEKKRDAFQGRDFDYLAYFSQDYRFSELFNEYELIATIDTIQVYRHVKSEKALVRSSAEGTLE